MDEQAKPAKKRIYKRWWFWVLVVIVFFVIVGASGGKKDANTAKQSVPAASDNTTASTSQQTNQQAQPTPVVAQTLLDISGTGTKSTQKFTAAGDWDMNWSYDCSNFGTQGNFQVMVYNSDGSMSFQNNLVNQLGKSGTDVEHYHAGGTYYLEVNSECKWKISIKG